MFCVKIYVWRNTSGLGKWRKKNAQKRAKLIALHAQEIRKKSQKNICAKITQILRKKYGHFVKTRVQRVQCLIFSSRVINLHV